MLKEQESSIDMKKVYSLLNLLQSNTIVYTEEKLLLIQFMTGSITYSELIKKLNEQ